MRGFLSRKLEVMELHASVKFQSRLKKETTFTPSFFEHPVCKNTRCLTLKAMNMGKIACTKPWMPGHFTYSKFHSRDESPFVV